MQKKHSEQRFFAKKNVSLQVCIAIVVHDNAVIYNIID